MPDEIKIFVAGVLAAGFLVSSAFFLTFWSRTKEFLFATFAIAFALLALDQALPVAIGAGMDDKSDLFLTRAIAFGLIILGILKKNVRG